MPRFLTPLRLRLGLVIVAWLAYSLSFSFFYGLVGQQALGLVLVPTLVTAYLLSSAYGLLAAGLAITINALLFMRLEGEASITRYIDAQGIFDLTALLMLAVCVATISQSRRLFQSRAPSDEEMDALTGVLSRPSFEKKLSQALHVAATMELNLAVLVIDLHRFKTINDNFGRDMGDALLQQIAHDLAGSLRQGDIIGRLGGDEFIIALQGLTNATDAAKVAEQLAKLIHSPLMINQITMQVTGNIGISLFPGDAQTTSELMKHAEAAMYEAKRLANPSIHVSAQVLQSRRTRMLLMERALAEAVANQQLELRYQPQVELATGKTLGFEALVRWNSPEFGMVSPAEFIPLAEKTRDIIPIGQWVIKEACTQQQRWKMAGFPDLRVAVNVSVVEFAEADLSKTIHQILQETGVSPEHLEIEITESLMIQNLEHTTETLRVLSNLGVHTALDDFGTGHSSLAYLQRLPIETLKIDRVFIMYLENLEHPQNSDATIIVESILAMAHKMRKRVVAEGIETAAQSAFLASLKCAMGQGYYYGKPLSEVEAARYLENEFSTQQNLKTMVDTVDDRFDRLILREHQES